MANDVFANGREISCKAASGKSIAAFPDVCFTPPQTPPMPLGIPIPYPNTAFAKHTSKGSKKVKISGKEVMLKNRSFFKTSTGDEPGRAPKKGILTSKIKGKAYFKSWSMDVKIEGANVVRHMDITTHNHGSPPNTPPQLYLDSIAPPSDPDCVAASVALDAECNNLPPSLKPRPATDNDGPSCTLAVGKVKGAAGNRPGHSGVASSTIARGRKYLHYAKGIQRGEQSNATPCGSTDKFEYDDTSGRPKQGHAEAKIIEDWFRSGAQGVLVLKISRPPCPDCTRLINEVNKGTDGKGDCNKIKVCSE
jgi:hypothetical protein